MTRTWRRRLARALAALASACAVLISGFFVLDAVFPLPAAAMTSGPSAARFLDRSGQLLLRQVATDGELRFPLPLEAMGEHAPRALVAVEDERFPTHPGISPVAIGRAVLQNLRSGRVVSGASTITMQVCRMRLHKGRPRTLGNKSVEAFRALQLERALSKDDILTIYLNEAPFGGNLRGLAAAAERYCGKRPRDLTLAEAALLVGIPQSPARLRPDRFPGAARKRRRKVLRRMREEGMITAAQERRANDELLPAPRHARDVPAHAALVALARRPRGGRLTIDPAIQTLVEEALRASAQSLPRGAEVAACVIDVEGSALLALVGGIDPNNARDGQVCGALARRSPGSTLKPFVYALAFSERSLRPDTVVSDRPVRFGGWTPKNFDGRYRGELPAEEALRTSLNIPALAIARALGLGRVVGTLRTAGLDLDPNAAARGGLAVITGAAETTLLSLTNAYATLARGYPRDVALFVDEAGEGPGNQAERRALFSPRARAALDRILSQGRPGAGWFMAKTGTSSGHRDALAIGHNGRYAIGVWVGVKRGAKSPGLTGARSALPRLASLFAHPSLRVESPPPRETPWAIRRALRLPGPPGPSEANPGRSLRIVDPLPGSTLLAPNRGSLRITPRLTGARADEVHAFLNGESLGPLTKPLELGVGRFELRCVDREGNSAVSHFTVRR